MNTIAWWKSNIDMKEERKARRLSYPLSKKDILELCRSGESSTIDYKSKRVVDTKRGESIEKHGGRVWIAGTVDE